MSTDHNFWREGRAEAESNQRFSAYLALPLGQAGSHTFATPDTVIISGSQLKTRTTAEEETVGS